MISDFHTHTEFSGDSEAPVREQIKRAIALGMDSICITDHNDYDAAGGNLDFVLDLPAYIPCLQKLQNEYRGRIQVFIGMELGLQRHIKDYLYQTVSEYPFDFIIGSSHFINRRDPYEREYFEGRSEEEAYEEFFQVSLERVRELDCFDVYGHLDYVVRYGPNQNRFYSYDSCREYIDPLLKLLVERGQGLECNTGGYKYGLGSPNPCPDILRQYKKLGGEIVTVGSDAHSPEHIGYAFDQAREVLTACGFRYYTVFEGRKPRFIKL